MGRETYVTLTTCDAYCIGALVLGTSLRQVHTAKELTIMVTANVNEKWRQRLRKTYDNIIDVTDIRNRFPLNIYPTERNVCFTDFTKIHCWNLVQFSKAVYLDADTLVLYNIDELFEREELSAAPDPRWPDCFNSGVFVFQPSVDTFRSLEKMASETGSFDGRDQGLLNTYFSDWMYRGSMRRLPYIYNCICSITDEPLLEFYTSPPAWVQFGGSIRVAHFAGPIKPWHRPSAAKNCTATACAALLAATPNRRSISRTSGMLAYWWSLFLVFVQPYLTSDMTSAVGNLGQLNLQSKLCTRHARSEVERMYAWERGEIDYTGVDRFSNILAKLCDTMTKAGGGSNLPIALDMGR